MCLDLKTDFLHGFSNWPEGVAWTSQKQNMFCGAVAVSDVICMCPYDAECFITFDMKKSEMQKWDWNYPYHAFCKCIRHKDDIWMISEGKYPYIIKYSLHNKAVKKISIADVLERDKGTTYVMAGVSGDIIIALSYHDGDWLVIDTHTDEVKKIDTGEAWYSAATCYKDGLVVTEGWSKPIKFISGTTHEISNLSFLLNDEEKKACLTHVVERSEGEVCSVKESDYSLDIYMDVILERKNTRKSPSGAYGEKIYNSIAP